LCLPTLLHRLTALTHSLAQLLAPLFYPLARSSSISQASFFRAPYRAYRPPMEVALTEFVETNNLEGRET
jgi:hypothetical protein